MPERTNRIVITGAAGLVGQNLVTLLLEEGYRNIVAIDKYWRITCCRGWG